MSCDFLSRSVLVAAAGPPRGQPRAASAFDMAYLVHEALAAPGSDALAVIRRVRTRACFPVALRAYIIGNHEGLRRGLAAALRESLETQLRSHVLRNPFGRRKFSGYAT